MDLRPKFVFLMGLAFLLVVSLGPNASSGAASANLAAVLDVSPKTAVPNQTVAVFGIGFSPAVTGGGRLLSGAHQITGQGDSVVSVNGSPLTPPNIKYPINFDTSGSWAASITVPLTSEIVTGSSITIQAVDDQGITRTTQLGIKTPTISLDPESSGRSSNLSVTGEGFPASNTSTAPDVQVSINYAGTPLKVVSTDARGAINTTVRIPESVVNGSTNVVSAALVGFNRVAIAIHSVPGVGITLSPSGGRPGSQLTISGDNFPSSATVTSIRAGNIAVLGSPAPVSDTAGRFVSTFVIPLFSPGLETITATAGGITAVSSFTVLDGPAMPLPTPVPQPSTAPTLALNELSGRDNLLIVWAFDNSTKVWAFYDPRPAFADANTIKTMVAGRVYWFKLNRSQLVVLNGRSRLLTEGWNLVSW